MRPAKIVAALAASAFLYVVAAVLGVPTLYFMSACVLSTLFASWLFSFASLKSLVVNCPPLVTGHAGDTLTLRLSLRNVGRTPKFLLAVDPALPTEVECASPPEVRFCPQLAPRRQWQTELRLLPGRRGAYRLDTVRVTCLDPLGMFCSTRRLSIGTELLVYPKLVSLSSPLTRGLGESSADRLARPEASRRGTDFHGIREYVPGDELRRIHWKSSARHGHFHVLEFELLAARSVRLLLDDEATAWTGDDAFDRGCSVAASLLNQCHRQGCQWELSLLSQSTTPSGGTTFEDHRARVLRDYGRLARAHPSQEAPPQLATQWLLEAGPSGSHCVVVTGTKRARRVELLNALQRGGDVPSLYLVGEDSVELIEGMEPGRPALGDSFASTRRRPPVLYPAGVAA